MKIWNYSSEAGEVLTESAADPCPVQEDVG
ncbi:hypothetical protein ABID62_006266 [Bradyrhizobium sp. S3.9.1]